MRVPIYRAQAIQGRAEPFPLTIEIAERFPSNLSPEAGEAAHELDARALADALWRSLPGGTLDRLFAELARRYVSRLRVARPDPTASRQRGEVSY